MQKRASRFNEPAIFTRSEDRRDRIADILWPRSGRRVTVVALGGADALCFAPGPNGLEVCGWPKPVATDTDEVRALLNGRARDCFVERLRVKAYWSERAARGSRFTTR